MRSVRFGALFAISAGLVLSACGSSEFATKVQAWCEADGKNARFTAAKYDCACVANAFDGALDSDNKVIFLTARVEGTGSASDVEKGVKKTGANPKEDLDGFRAKLKAFIAAENAAEEKAESSCKKG